MKKEHTDGLTLIGDLMKADLRFKPPTKTQWRLIEAAAEIGMGEEGPPTYQHTVLCQTSLPYRRTAERILERRNGRTMLRVEAGTAYSEREDAWVELPLPFIIGVVATRRDKPRIGAPEIALGQREHRLARDIRFDGIFCARAVHVLPDDRRTVPR